MSNTFSNPRSLGALQPFVANNPVTIIALRAPTTDDKAPIGQLWIDTSTDTFYALTSINSGIFNWETLGGTGGGVFQTVTITGPGNPVLDVTGNSDLVGDITLTGDLIQTGDIDLTGDLTVTGNTDLTGNFSSVSAIQTTIESSLAGSASSIFLNASNASGGVTVEGGTGGITLDAANGIVSVQSGTAAINVGTDATAHVVTVGSTAGASSTVIQAGSNGVTLSAGGDVRPTPAVASVASPLDTATINHRVGVATFTGYTTAQAASDTLGINSSFITNTSGMLLSIASLNASTNGAFLTLDGVITGTGGVVLQFTNNGAGALGAGDDIIVTFWVIS